MRLGIFVCVFAVVRAQSSETLLASVVIPALCEELKASFLTTALSIKIQSVHPHEIILVASGCTSADHSIFQLYKNLLFPVPLVVRAWERRLTAAAARNAGSENATGTHILFMDADDLMVRNYVQSVLHIFEITGATMVLHGFYNDFLNCDSIKPKIVADTHELQWLASKKNDSYWISPSVAHGHVSLRADAFRRTRYKECRGCEDTLFVRNVLKTECKKSNDCVFTSAALSVYIGRFYQNNMAEGATHYMFRIFQKIMQTQCNQP